MTDKVSRRGRRGTSAAVAATATAPGTVPVTRPTATTTTTDVATTTTTTMVNDASEPERCCWICFATDEDNRLASWVKPCRCRGTTKWVHPSCLYRWIDEKMNSENSLRATSCPQCQTEYIIVHPGVGKIGAALETVDKLFTRMCPFMTAGFCVCSLYWTAVTFGAITFLQVVGADAGLCIMQTGDPVLLLIGLPIIPIGLVLLRMIQWENAVLQIMHDREMMEEEIEMAELVQQQFLSYPTRRPAAEDAPSPVRTLCGALLLPTISTIVGRILFESVQSPIQRTLLGGLTFVVIKGVFKIYLRHRQYTSRRGRHIVDYTEENLRTYMPQNSNNNNNRNAINATRQGQQQNQRNGA